MHTTGFINESMVLSPNAKSHADQRTASRDVDGATRLLRLATLGKELGAEHIANEGRGLAARVAEGRFYLACIGQFKRGKSTLINALVGECLLPVGFVPVTAVPTVIRYGPQRRARVQFRDGS